MELLAGMDDQGLIRARDTATLFERYYGPVFGLIRRLLGDGPDAQDAAQETFARAFAHLEDFKDGASFRTWIFSIAANHVRDLVRRRRPVRLDPALEEELSDLSLPDERLLRVENRERVLDAVGALPFELQVVVTLQFQEECSPGEIALALGISVNAVRIRLYRALAALRKELT